MNYQIELENFINALDISDFDFGSEEAEKDLLLSLGYFVPNASLKSVLAWNKNIVIGSKGSGKSAIYNYLISNGNYKTFFDNNVNSKFNNSHYIPVSIKRKTEFKELFLNNSESENINGFEKVWTFIIFSTAFSFVVRNNKFRNLKSYKKFISQCKANGIFISLWNKKTKTVSLIISKLLSGLKLSVTPEGNTTFEFSSNFNFEEYKRNLSKIKIHNLSESLEELLKEANYKLTIAVDNLDVIFSYDKSWEVELIRALFEVNSELKPYTFFRILIFIRTDILQSSEIVQIDKVITSSIQLEWDSTKVIDLIYSRICSLDGLKEFNEKFTDISEESKKKTLLEHLFYNSKKGEHIPHHKDWIGDNLSDSQGNFLPRSIIQLFNHYCFSSYNLDKNTYFFDISHLEKSLLTVSRTLYDILQNDYKIAQQVLEIIESNNLYLFKLDDIKKYFPPEEVNFVLNQLKSLSKVGVLISRPIFSEDTEIKYSYEISPLYRHHLK